jgi:hypothetical protein
MPSGTSFPLSFSGIAYPVLSWCLFHTNPVSKIKVVSGNQKEIGEAPKICFPLYHEKNGGGLKTK